MTFTGTITDNAFTGTYSINGGCANGDQGKVTGVKVPNNRHMERHLTTFREDDLRAATMTQGNTSSGYFGLTGTVVDSLLFRDGHV